MSAPVMCVHDSGSATGCRPACDSPAVVEMTHTGYRGPYAVRLCRRHADRLAGRIYPDTVTGERPL